MTERTIEERLQELEAKSLAHGMTVHFVVSEFVPAEIRAQVRDGFLRALRQADAATAPFPPQVAIDELEHLWAGFPGGPQRP